MKYLKRGLVGVVVGAAIGAIFGVLALWGTIHRMTAVGVVINGAIYGGGAGAIGGLIVGVVNGILTTRGVGEAIGRRTSRIIGPRVVGMLVGASNGMVIGCITGATIEVIAFLLRPRLFSIGTMCVTTVIGVAIGIAYGIVAPVKNKAVSELIDRVISGMLLGIVVGLIFEVDWIVSTSLTVAPDRRIPATIEGAKSAITLAIAAVIFGIFVAVISGIIVERLGKAAFVMSGD